MSEPVTFVWKQGPPLSAAERRRLLQLLFGDPNEVRCPENGPTPGHLVECEGAGTSPAVSQHPGDGTVAED